MLYFNCLYKKRGKPPSDREYSGTYLTLVTETKGSTGLMLIRRGEALYPNRLNLRMKEDIEMAYEEIKEAIQGRWSIWAFISYATTRMKPQSLTSLEVEFLQMGSLPSMIFDSTEYNQLTKQGFYK